VAIGLKNETLSMELAVLDSKNNTALPRASTHGRSELKHRNSGVDPYTERWLNDSTVPAHASTADAKLTSRVY